MSRVLAIRPMLQWHFNFLDPYFRENMEVVSSKMNIGTNKEESIGIFLIQDPSASQISILKEHGMVMDFKPDNYVIKGKDVKYAPPKAKPDDQNG